MEWTGISAKAKSSKKELSTQAFASVLESLANFSLDKTSP
jgi:hypothetical protein